MRLRTKIVEITAPSAPRRWLQVITVGVFTRLRGEAADS